MSKKPFSQIVTANALIEGDVIYFTAQSTWSRDIADAELFTDPDRANAQLALANSDQSVVAGVYLVDATAGEDGPEPVHFREDFRMTGPSNYHHGKQAELS